jgi:hypothetical protein
MSPQHFPAKMVCYRRPEQLTRRPRTGRYATLDELEVVLALERHNPDARLIEIKMPLVRLWSMAR